MNISCPFHSVLIDLSPVLTSCVLSIVDGWWDFVLNRQCGYVLISSSEKSIA